MKLAIIIVVVLVLLGGGGAATWFLVLKEDPNAEPPPPEPTATVFLELDAMNVPVLKNGVIERYILLRVTLDLRDEEAKQLAQDYMPKLRDRYINDLYGYFENLPTGAKGVNVKTIKRRMLNVSDALLGKGAVQKILVQGVFERPWNGGR